MADNTKKDITSNTPKCALNLRSFNILTIYINFFKLFNLSCYSWLRVINISLMMTELTIMVTNYQADKLKIHLIYHLPCILWSAIYQLFWLMRPYLAFRMAGTIICGVFISFAMFNMLAYISFEDNSTRKLQVEIFSKLTGISSILSFQLMFFIVSDSRIN